MEKPTFVTKLYDALEDATEIRKDLVLLSLAFERVGNDKVANELLNIAITVESLMDRLIQNYKQLELSMVFTPRETK